MNLIPVGFDTETHLIDYCKLAPPIVCGTFAVRDANGGIDHNLSAIADPNNRLYNDIKSMLSTPDVVIVIQFAAFDLAVVAANFPDLIPLIFQALEEGRVRCTKIQEMLLNLTTHGQIDFIPGPNGEQIDAKYNLDVLCQKYTGTDLSLYKKGEDTWRLNYDQLTPIPSAEWPDEAATYAIMDAVEVLDIDKAQREYAARILAERGHDPLAVASFQVAADFALRLMSCWPVKVDNERRRIVAERVAKELDPANFDLLYETGLLRPAVPPRPHSNGARDHLPDCPNNGKGSKCNCPVKMTKGEDETRDTKKLQAFVQQLALDFPEEVTLKKTAPSTKFPEGQLSINAEWMKDHEHLSPVIAQLCKRQSMQKLVNTELPRMCFRDKDGKVTHEADFVHPLYDILKKTGRTSAKADDKFPSFNCQNVHPEVRECYVPREGSLMFSVDFSYMELVTFAQTCYDLFKFSQLRDIINAGKDPHAWLGSQLILQLDPDFRENVLKESDVDAEDTEGVYQAFMALKKCGIPEWEAAFKKWRTFAKPTGLGYPGGLGARKFVQYAKATYGVIIDLETAQQLKDAWLAALPEAQMYFDWVREQIDPWNGSVEREFPDGTKRMMDRYAYTSPMGMNRAACDYCAVANGKGLQTPSGEGAKLAVWNVVRACYDPTMGSILYGTTRPQLFVHDEILGEVLDNDQTHEYATEIGRIMVAAFRTITPDVEIKAAPVLMRRWNKAAEPVFDANGRLTVWEPKAK